MYLKGTKKCCLKPKMLAKTKKLTEENINFHDFGLGIDFLDMIPKA